MNASQFALNRAHITDVVEFDDTVTVTVVCPFDGGTNVVKALAVGFKAWAAGALIQDALPTLDESDIELLMSGLCDCCQDDLFSSED